MTTEEIGTSEHKKERVRAASRRHYLANKERLNAQSRAWSAANREAINARKRTKYSANRERILAEAKAAYAADKEKFRRRNRFRKGLPDQPGPTPEICECCGSSPQGRQGIHLDHDHLTGAFRGWLCGNCNRAIGMLGDSPEGIERAVRYLAHKSFESDFYGETAI